MPAKIYRLVCALVLALAAGQAKADVTLHFLFTQPPETWDAVIAAFEKENPAIHIERQQVPFDALNAQVQSRIGGKDAGIDVYGTDEPRVPAFARRGFLVDLSDLRATFEAAVSPEAIAAVSAEGKIWSFPLWTSTQVLFYNKDLLARAGLSAPSIDPKQRITWEALLADAKKAQAAGAKWAFTFDQVDRYYQLQPLFESNGGGTGLTGPDVLTPAIDKPGWIGTAEWYGKLFADGLAPRGIPAEQMPPLFAAGQVAYIYAGPWQMALFNKSPDLHYGMAAVPYFASGKPSTPTDSWSIGINPYGEHRAEAIKFASFMTLNPQGALLSTEKAPLPPANKAAFEAYLKRMAEMGPVTVGYDTLVRYELANTAVHRPRSIGWVNFEQVINKAFSDIRNGADAGTTLKTADDALVRAFARLR